MFSGDKQAEKYDALSLIIIELDHNERKSSGAPAVPGTEYPNSGVELVTFGHDGFSRRRVTKRAQYSDRIWPGSHNPNFLLSGQLSGNFKDLYIANDSNLSFLIAAIFEPLFSNIPGSYLTYYLLRT